MSEPRDELAPLEQQLAQADQLTCPVCRLVQDLHVETCGRCAADLGLLSRTLVEASQHRAALYQALLGGDGVTAQTHLEALVRLTGPTTELAVLRKLLRHGAVPVEVLGDLDGDVEDWADRPLGVYQPLLADDPLQPVGGDEQTAFAGLLPAEPEPELAPEVAAPDEAAPAPVPPRMALGDWAQWGLGILAALAFGLFIGRHWPR